MKTILKSNSWFSGHWSTHLSYDKSCERNDRQTKFTVCSLISGPTYFEPSWWLCLELGLPPVFSASLDSSWCLLCLDDRPSLGEVGPFIASSMMSSDAVACWVFGLAMDSDVFSGERSKPKLLSLLRLEEEVAFLDGDRSIPEDTIPPSSDDDTLGEESEGEGMVFELFWFLLLSLVWKKEKKLDLDLFFNGH